VGSNGATSCEGGGTRTAAPKGTTKKSRVDNHDKAGWRGGGLAGELLKSLPPLLAATMNT
jgi:hypothetical protein